MTNGNIDARVDATTGPKLTVTYKGGQQTIVVDPKTPIVGLAPGAPTDLKPGAAIIARGPSRRMARSTPRSCWSARTGSSLRCEVRPSLSSAHCSQFAGLSRLVLPKRRFTQKTVHDARVVEFNRDQAGFARAGYVIYLCPRQADPLRRRRLSDPMVPLGAAVQHAGLHEQPGRGRRQREVLGTGTSRSNSTPMTRPTAAWCRAASFVISSGGRPRAGWPRRRAIEPVSARRRSRAAVSRRGPAGLHRRLPRLGLHRDAAGNADRRCARRRRWAFRCSPAKRRSTGSTRSLSTPGAGNLKPLYNFMDNLPSLEGEPAPILPRKHRRAHHRATIRASISAAAVPINVPSAPSSTCRAARAASARPTTSNRSSAPTGAGHRPVLHHRRQFRPQHATGRSCSTG